MNECDPARARSAEEQAWLDLVPVGLEIEALDSVSEASGKPRQARDDGVASGAPRCSPPREGE